MADIRAITNTVADALPRLQLERAPVDSLFTGANTSQLEALLPDYVKTQRWFGGKQHDIESTRITDMFPIPDASAADGAPAGYMALVDVTLANGAGRDIYAMPLVARNAADLDQLMEPLARVSAANGDFVLADGAGDARFIQGLHDIIRGERELVGGTSRMQGESGPALERAMDGVAELRSSILSAHTSNTSVKLAAVAADGALEPLTSQVIKIVRRHDADTPPGVPGRALDVWKGVYLTDEAKYANTPRVFGSIEHASADGSSRTLAVLSEFAKNDGDSWSHALARVDDILTTAMQSGGNAAEVTAGIDSFARIAGTHGKRLGELHQAFASGTAESGFTPIKATLKDLREAKAALRADAAKTIEQLRASGAAPPGGRSVDELVAGLQTRVDRISNSMRTATMGDRIHTHGDFHLGQMLAKGDDALIIDLEGAPALPLAQRWQRTGALGDVARQRSSYEYAAAQGIKALEERGVTGVELENAKTAAAAFVDASKRSFLDGWQGAVGDASFVPKDVPRALDHAELSNALYETSYELGSRPDWVSIPLTRLERLATAQS
ncbi:MAG: 1,4-alpha-glucan branching enzyme [Thermoleophilia bacterium]|nr:1,4-alpha-glucan branching enzyme [Thermoleophilia bacterium]MCZ4495878.1 1,4-alpha-glucan branching enzyme [Thermoleophilia bacterium]